MRNRSTALTPELNLVGRPPKLYQTVLKLLTDVYDGRVSAELLLIEVVRCLIEAREEQKERTKNLLAQLQDNTDAVPLAAEAIVTLIEQHLASPHSSRLPVLVVAAAYQSASVHLGEKALPLHAHNAADKQTRALGDIEIALITDDHIVTVYEMKTKKITKEDVENAVAKIATYFNRFNKRIEQYIFITTESIDRGVADYIATLYESTGGVEFAILDCIGFLRHFLHIFHRNRMLFLEAYQELVLAEPSSAVNDALKDLLLALRRASESGTSGSFSDS